MSAPSWRPVVAPAVLAVVALGFAAADLQVGADAPSTDFLYEVNTEVGLHEYGPEARALLGGLAAGDTLAGEWNVREIEGPLPDGRVRVLVERDGVSLVLTVLPTGRSAFDPPGKTRQWDIYYGDFDPEDAEFPEDHARPLLDAIVDRVRANEEQ